MNRACWADVHTVELFTTGQGAMYALTSSPRDWPWVCKSLLRVLVGVVVTRFSVILAMETLEALMFPTSANMVRKKLTVRFGKNVYVGKGIPGAPKEIADPFTGTGGAAITIGVAHVAPVHPVRQLH